MNQAMFRTLFRAMFRARLPVLVILLNAEALATTNKYVPFPFMYAGLDIGEGQYTSSDETFYDPSESHRVFGGHLGYQFNPYLSAELAYQNAGDALVRDIPYPTLSRFNQVGLSGRLGYELTDKFYHYLKLGGVGWFGEAEGLESNDVKGFSPLYGAGILYTHNENMVIRFEYHVTHNLGYANTDRANYQQGMLGFSWQFGRTLKPSLNIQEKVIEVTVIEVPVEVLVIKERIVFAATGTEALFAHDESVLVNSRALRNIVTLMKQYPVIKITVTGHTDSTGTQEYNQRLSERRARTIADHFQREGIDRNRMIVIGKGELWPVEDNNSEQGRVMNRRAEIEILAHSINDSSKVKVADF